METTNLVMLVLFSDNEQLANWKEDEDLVELIFIPSDDTRVECYCWELYEMIG